MNEWLIEEAARSHAPDSFLSTIVRLGDRNDGSEFAVTVFVGSLIVSGTAVPIRAWWEHVADVWEQGNGESADHLRAMGMLHGIVEEDGDSGAQPPVMHIHLRDAWIWRDAGDPIQVTMWRGRLGSIDGYCLGRWDPD